jgi:hypothetical protein
MIVAMHLDLVALADADELAGHMAAEGPEGVADAAGEPPHDFPHFEMHDDLGGMVVMDRRGTFGASVSTVSSEPTIARKSAIAARISAADRMSGFVNSDCTLAKKGLAFRSKESVYAVVGGRRSGRGTLRPGDRADPGLASVRGRNWFGPSRHGGFDDVIQT